MTVSTEVDHNDYIGNGVTTSFPYTFRIFKKSDLVVQVADLSENLTELTLDTDYTVTGAGGYTGGNVVLSSPLANGYQISISRELPVTQETDLRNQGKFFAEVHEDAFDKLTMLIQQVRSWLSLALRKPSFVANYYDAKGNKISNVADPVNGQDVVNKNYFGKSLRVPESSINELPIIELRKNKILAFNESGNPMPVLPESGSASDVMIELAKSSGASLIGSQSGKGVQQDIIDGDSAYYRARCISNLAKVDYLIRSKGNISVLFQGDSMTAGYDVTSTDSVPPEQGDIARHATTTYPERFTAYLSEQSGATVTGVIRAISGYTAKQAYENPDWQSNPNCQIAILMYGLNDAAGTSGSTHDIYMENMEKLIRRFIDWGMGVVVMSCASGGYGSTDQVAQSYARQLKNMATIYGCAHFNANEVQYNRKFGAVQSDNIHFNSNGYAKLADCIASMFLAGGLLPNYRPVSSEIQVWPGIQSDQVAYCDPSNSINLERNSGAYSLQRITGIIPRGKLSIMSFSFYLDAEVAEVDVIGAWSANSGLNFIFNQQTVSSAGNNVDYYDRATYSSNLTNELKSFTGLPANATTASSSGVGKNIGLMVGRGWKTITIFANGTDDSYIQGVTIRPVSSYLCSRSSPGSQRRGIKEVYMVSIPYRDFKPSSGIPSGFSLISVVTPLPYDLHSTIWDNNANYFDSGFAKIVVSGIQDNAGVVYYEALISKTTGGDTYTVTELKSIGTWPTVTAVRGTKSRITSTSAGSVGPNMPLENIYATGDDSTFTSGSVGNELGLFMKIIFNWNGTPPTGYYNVSVESFARGIGGAASMATL
ncbi:Phage tail fibers [Citrobacter portucalensis]|uniref:SGNH/GDSL hydrolase family protein n=1 Tax=Citrobacter portucalensis TaxID=1639133 RepID=UPI0006BDF2EE|nr:SGNH/GDSL hydrolase family protein [Citrobacter portucalensis]ALD78835.1 Phage tail fibers [Citrobacter portucalensis]